jgi:hypothetical protein
MKISDNISCNVSRKNYNFKELFLKISIFLMLASWLYGIPPIPGMMPRSPMYLFTVLVTLLLLEKVLLAFRVLIKRVEFFLFFAIVAIVMLIDMCFGILSIASMLLQFCAIFFILCIYVFSTKSQENQQFIIASTIILLTVSALWFLAEISIKDPFLKWRLFIYQELYKKDTIDFTLTRCGLVSALHLLGYQLSILVPFLLIKLFGNNRFGFKESLYALSLILSLCALWFSSQRSTVMGVMACLLYFSFQAPALIYKSKKVMRVAIVVLIALIFTTYNFWDRVGLQKKDLINKFNTSTIAEDDRFTLQMSALYIIFDYPLGLKAANLNWVQANKERNIRTSIAVHNVYLGLALKGGIIILLLEIVFLFKIVSTCLKKIKFNSTGLGYYYEKDRLMMYGAAISCFLLQPMFHNSGLFIFDGSSMVCFAFFLIVKYHPKIKINSTINPCLVKL